MDRNAARLIDALRAGVKTTVKTKSVPAELVDHHRLRIASVSIEGQDDVSGDVVNDLLWSRKLLILKAPADNNRALYIELSEAGRAAEA